MIQYRGRCYVSWKDGAGSLSTTKYVDLLQSNQSSANYTFRNNWRAFYKYFLVCMCVDLSFRRDRDSREKRKTPPGTCFGNCDVV